MLVTTVATLAVAALALLGPLEQSLRNAEKQTLRHDLTRSTIAGFKKLHLGDLPSPEVAEALSRQQQQLSVRIGSIVTVLGYPEANGQGRPLLPPRLEGGILGSDSFDDVTRAFATRHSVYSFGFINGTDYARAAIPFANGEIHYVLAVRKPIDEIAGAVQVVRRAFITAALAGLVLTLILGIPLSATLVRRLRRLRQAALKLAQQGPVVEVPDDRARDEVGDLARTLATMQQRLQQQEEARRSFVATASHELRTPLTSLDGMLELLDDDLRYEQPDLEDARALLDRARVQSRRLGRLAADLLDLSRLDARSDLRSEPVELGELSRAVLAEFELGTAERGIDTEINDHGGSVWTRGDPGSIARILRILLDNAVRLSPAGSKLEIELRSGAEVTLSVSDQGPGVPREEREQIFRRFERGRDTGGKAGFGLGLAIGRELAERMGGELVLEERDGPGATFTLRLPSAASPVKTLSGSAS
ncbi:MAG TPA: HAMP domain-containing sensor histidine kinase [Solirubrobacteraceae bacterium]